MSTFVVDARRPERDPGRMYSPPAVTRGGWFLRWGLTGIALLGNVGVLVGSAAVPEMRDAMSYWTSPWRLGVDAALTLLCFWLITHRRDWPVLVASGMTVFTTVSSGAGAFLPWAMVSLATRRRWREVLPVAALSLAAQSVGMFIPGYQPSVRVGDDPVEPAVLARGLSIGFGALWLLVLVVIGFYVGARRDLVASLVERAETAEREQRLMVEAGKASERARIAREMHDVLAHRISLVSMHAGVLAYRDDLDPAQTKQIAGIIQENAHASLSELRQVLATLREPTQLGAAIEKPQPTLADLPILVREAELSGTCVELHDEIGASCVPPALARHAFRMVQEALTNARKHAVGAPVSVALSGRPGKGLSLEVRNPMTSDTGVPGARLGLVGLGERAQIMGGTFEAGPEHGDFVVRAWLPWEK